MHKNIALITTKPGVVSGVTVFMDLIQRELQARGYGVSLIRPEPHSFQSVTSIASILGYGLARERLEGFDLVMGNGVGLTGAVDLPLKVIDNIHSTASGANRSLEQAFADLSGEERQWLDVVLPPLMGHTWQDIPMALTAKQSSFEVDRIAAQRSDAIITVSPGTRQEVLDFFEIGSKHVDVVPNGIDEPWFAPRELQSVVSESEVNVVYTGRAGYTTINIFWKGFDRILAVLSQVRGAKPLGIFHLGVSTTRQTYETLLRDAGIDYRFDVANKELPTYLRAGDIYIQTSRYEACSLSIMEAMASGLAPIAFPSGMIEDIIRDGENGFIVRSIPEMKHRIDELIADPVRRIEMGRSASQTIRDEYSVAKMVDGYERVISGLLDSNPNGA